MLVTHIAIYTLFKDTQKKHDEQDNPASVASQPIIPVKTALISWIISDCNAKPSMADADSIGGIGQFFHQPSDVSLRGFTASRACVCICVCSNAARVTGANIGISLALDSWLSYHALGTLSCPLFK